jgi:hypothetical protein
MQMLWRLVDAERPHPEFARNRILLALNSVHTQSPVLGIPVVALVVGRSNSDRIVTLTFAYLYVMLDAARGILQFGVVAQIQSMFRKLFSI